MRGIVRVVLSVALTAVIAVPSRAEAADSSQLQLAIVPTVCVIDVVQDGSHQQLQADQNCTTALPDLIAPFPQAGSSARLFLPFAGSPAESISNTTVVRQPPQVFRADWSPVAGPAKNERLFQESVRIASSLTAGLIAIALVTSLGLDIVLFERRYSKAMGRWLRHLWWRG